MEIEDVEAELQALWKLYALHQQIIDGTGTPESTLPYLDERALTLLKDLLDRRWENTIRTYSELLSTAQPNQPPVPKRQCRYCRQRSLKRQTSIVQVLEPGRKLVQPRQVFVREARSVASTASNSSRIRRCKSGLEDSRRFGPDFSYRSWTTRSDTTSPSRSSYSDSDAFSPSESSSYASTYSVSRSASTSESDFSSYSIEKPTRKAVRTPITKVGPAKIGAFERLRNKLGLVFHHDHHHDRHRHRHGRGTSMWRQVKEMIRQGRRRRRSGNDDDDDDDVDKKGKWRSKLIKTPAASKQKAKNRKKRLHWWQLKRRRTEAGRNMKPNKSRTTTTTKKR